MSVLWRNRPRIDLIWLQGPQASVNPQLPERGKDVPLAADRYKRDVHREGIALHGRQIGQLHDPRLVMR
jgi:hypothetical protein